MGNVLAIFTVTGDPGELLAAYDRAMPAIQNGAADHGAPLVHVCAPAEDGIRIVDVWESEDALQRFVGHGGFRQALANAGLKEPDAIEVLPVHASGWRAVATA